jgi:uncharacterized membrane protein YbhN (UPF0104 family)
MTRSVAVRLLRWLGLAIGIAGLAFVFRRLIADWDTIRHSIAGARVGSLVLALLLGLLSMTGIGLVWRQILGHLGARVPIREALHRYFVGQLGKYVPGGIWPVVGRAEMARRSGVGGKAAYLSTMYSLVATYAGAFVTAAVASLLPAAVPSSWWWSRWMLPALVVGALLLHPQVLRRVVAILGRLSASVRRIEVPRWRETIGAIALHIPSWIGISTATWLVVIAYGGAAPWWALLLVTPLAWLAGFVVIASPGGIGVREAVLVAAISPWDPELSAAIALTARLIFVIVDLLGAGLSTAVFVRPQRNIET